MIKSKSMKKQYAILIFIAIVIVSAIVLEACGSEKKEESLTEDVVDDGNHRPDRELDPDVRKLFEADGDSAENYEVILVENSYYNQNGKYLFVDPEIVEHIVTNLSSLSIKEIDPIPYYEDMTRGLQVMVYPKGTEGNHCSFEILEKNEEGNYVISLEIFNEIVAEVVEGDLDYAYLKELYQERAREVGGTLEGESVE